MQWYFSWNFPLTDQWKRFLTGRLAPVILPIRIVILTQIFTCLALAGGASAQKPVVNGTDWKDTSGQPISAHEGFIGCFDGAFYWYGTSYKGNSTGKFGPEGAALQNPFHVYRSTNLVDWEFLGECLKFRNTGFGSGGTSHRPCVIYNDKTKKYVMWFFHFIKFPDIMLTVATSDHPAGPFVIDGLRKSGEPNGWAQDLGLFKDDDGKAYIVYDDGHRNLRVDLLTDDYLDTTRKSIIALKAGPTHEQKYEGAAMAKSNGKYIVAGSGVNGWNHSDTTCAIADSPMGPYSAPARLGEKNSRGAQISNFFQIRETNTLVALFDQWWAGPAGKQDLDQSRYLLLPVELDPSTGTATMDYKQEWYPFGKNAPVKP